MKLMTVFAYGSHGAPAEREFRINVELALIGAGVLIIAGMIFCFCLPAEALTVAERLLLLGFVSRADHLAFGVSFDG